MKGKETMGYRFIIEFDTYDEFTPEQLQEIRDIIDQDVDVLERISDIIDIDSIDTYSAGLLEEGKHYERTVPAADLNGQYNIYVSSLG